MSIGPVTANRFVVHRPDVRCGMLKKLVSNSLFAGGIPPSGPVDSSGITYPLSLPLKRYPADKLEQSSSLLICIQAQEDRETPGDLVP